MIFQTKGHTLKLSHKEKQINDFSLIYRAKCGIAMEMQYSRLSSKDRALVCLIKGFLIFLCVFGSIGLFMTSFELPGMMAVLFLYVLILSIGISMFYYNRILFNVGYILLFIFICALAFFLYWYANSGMNAILNSALKIIDKKLFLNGVREYNEVIKDRRITVTCCLILISSLSICFFNSAISGYMSPLFTFILLYPIIQICAYFDDTINYGYLSLMLLGFIGVCFFRISGKFNMPYRGVSPDIRIQKEHIYHDSGRMVKTMLHLSAVSVVFLVIIMFISGLFVAITPGKMKNNYSSWKNTTDELVEQFALNGLRGFFNQYSATGGLNEGRLGGIREVQLSFDPQLDIKFVPDNVNGIYLRGFIGEYYDHNQWIRISDKSNTMASRYGISDTEQIVNMESTTLDELYNSGLSDYSAKAYMTVTNLNSLDKYFYTPYYSVVDYSDLAEINHISFDDRGDYVLYDNNIRTKNRELKHTYYPYFSLMEQYEKSAFSLPENPAERRYRRYVYDYYLSIPPDIQDELRQICDSHISSNDLVTAIRQIQQYFYEEFEYTLSPGITPSNKDFVLYFLEKQKKGFCAHFATAAAMLLRAKGIPARYVEGYYIEFTDATIVDTVDTENAEDWYQGYNATIEGDEVASLIKVQARGVDAHAWVEVYLDGFGWVPVEFTVADSAETEESGSFWDRFGSVFNSNRSENSPVRNVTEQFQAVAPFLIGFFAVAAIILLLFIFFLIVRRKIRLYHIRNNNRLVYQYKALSRLMKKTGIAGENNIYHNKMTEYLVTSIGLSRDQAEEYVHLVEKASFDNEALSKDELAHATVLFRTVLRAFRTTVNYRKKIRIVLST